MTTTTRALEHAIQHVKNGSTIELTTDDVLASWGLVRASRLSEMDAEIKRLRDAMRLIANRPTNIPIDPHGMAQFARAALEHQP